MKPTHRGLIIVEFIVRCLLVLLVDSSISVTVVESTSHCALGEYIVLNFGFRYFEYCILLNFSWFSISLLK